MMLWQLPLVLGEQTVNAETLSAAAFLGLKLMFIIAGLLYTVFAFVVIRQIRIMEKSLVTTLAGILRMLGYLHFLLSVLALIYFFLVL